MVGLLNMAGSPGDPASTKWECPLTKTTPPPTLKCTLTKEKQKNNKLFFKKKDKDK